MRRLERTAVPWLLAAFFLVPWLTNEVTNFASLLLGGIEAGVGEVVLAMTEGVVAAAFVYACVRFFRAPVSMWWGVAASQALFTVAIVVSIAAAAIGAQDSLLAFWSATDAADAPLPFAVQLRLAAMDLLPSLFMVAGAYLGALWAGRRNERGAAAAAGSENALHAPAPEPPPAEAIAPMFGEGPFPVELNRLNWGAFLLSGLWTLLHGLWRWWLLTVGLFVLTAGVGWWIRSAVGEGAAYWLWAVPGLVLSAIGWGLYLWFGLNANRRLWDVESARTARGQDPRSVSDVMRSQRRWGLAGIVLAAFSMLTEAVRVSVASGPQASTIVATAADILLAGAAILLAWLWDRRLRSQVPEELRPPPQPIRLRPTREQGIAIAIAATAVFAWAWVYQGDLFWGVQPLQAGTYDYVIWSSGEVRNGRFEGVADIEVPLQFDRRFEVYSDDRSVFTIDGRTVTPAEYVDVVIDGSDESESVFYNETMRVADGGRLMRIDAVVDDEIVIEGE